MAKLNLEQRKIQSLKRQLLGKPSFPKDKKLSLKRDSKSTPYEYSTTTSSLISQTHQSSNKYLKHDLLKVFFLTTLAIAAQLCLYWSLTKGLLVLSW